ncbi:aminoglycoside phosphotransferase family protein [Rudaea sp.]|uniref:aminoglycoside phosphotransferase family protein n=1 Tax=Rudaea sp. TaxID=2136325 RepID=UPI002ED42CF7
MTDPQSARRSELQAFVAAQFPQHDFSLAPASADASFRSYWRVDAGGETRVVMDAPPNNESIAPWLAIGARLHDAGLHTPQVFAVDHARGFILMEDLGNRTYLPELNAASADALYGDALDALLTMQTRVSPTGLPPFDEALLRTGMENLPTWFFDRHLGFVPDSEERATIESAFALLVANARAQPRVFVHRDFHSRNLMIVARDNPGIIAPGLLSPGIIDFQGALHGPIAYDLASLLRDCYIAWPRERVDAWMHDYHQRLRAAGVVDVDAAVFRRWFDLIGLQRHTRLLGQFCRLNYRDGKPGYLNDLPLTLRYVLDVARGYRELAAFTELIERAVGDRDITQPRAQEQVA